MFLPLDDDDRALTTPAVVTHLLVWSNILVFVYQVGHPAFTYAYSAIPFEILHNEDLVNPMQIRVGDAVATVPHAPGPAILGLTILTAMFMHGGFAHIIGNMLHLWIFGDNVEHRFGHLLFAIVYITSGIMGSVTHIVTNPNSILPSLGASGAISGVLGAYLILFPRNRVYCFFLIMVVSIPAYVVIGMWAFTQFTNGLGAIAMTEQTGGVAYGAHIGGFVTGVVAAWWHRTKLPEEPDSGFFRAYEHDPNARRIW